MKKIYFIFSILFVAFFSFTLNVKANSIDTIDMDIYINQNGEAIVNEVWKVYLNEGTEGYKPYYNLGNSKITNFTVHDEKTQYSWNDNWNVNSSFQDKAYKNGIVTKSDGIELCWGISEYGNKTYTLNYKITNFISKTSDNYQMLYWTLIPYELSSKPNQVSIKIHADTPFSDKLDVWGYGNYGGTAYVYNGNIEMNSDGVLNSDEYMTLLVKFPENTFKVQSDNLNLSFDEYHKMAEEGAKKYKRSIFATIVSIIVIMFPTILFTFIIFGIVVFSRNSLKYPRNGTKHLSFGTEGKTLKAKYQYYRDLPCNKDIFRAYWVATSYDLIINETCFLGAILLKWTKENVIKLDKKTEGVIFKKEETAIILGDKNQLKLDLEKKLYDMIYEASIDGILESKEFEKWCKNHYSKILGWFDEVIDYETEQLVLEGKCKKQVIKTYKFFSTIVYEVDPIMKEEAEQLLGLKHFLNDFSNLSKTHPIEVFMWEEYLMFAQILGMAKQVAKEFKKIYPDEISDLSINTVIFINDISYSGMTAANDAKSRAEAYSSGGGGFSSGGGGGGSFGGGGGGGGFR